MRRPDILQAEQQLIASNALIGAARALFFPRISLTGLLGFASGSLGNLFSGPARTWSFTGDVVGPIYTGGGLTAAVDQAEARRDQSLRQLRARHPERVPRRRGFARRRAPQRRASRDS